MDISVSTVKRSMAHASSRLSRWIDADPGLAGLMRAERWGRDDDPMSSRRSEGRPGAGRAHGAGTRRRQAAHDGGARPGAAHGPARGSPPARRGDASLRRWSLLGATAGACVVVAPSSRVGVRERALAPEPAVAVSRIEGGDPARRRISVPVGPRGRQAVLQRGKHVRADAGHARAAALGRRGRRAPGRRTRHRRAPGHAEPRAPVVGRGGAVPGHREGDGVHGVVGSVERAVRAARCDTVASWSAAPSWAEASRCSPANVWSSACRRAETVITEEQPGETADVAVDAGPPPTAVRRRHRRSRTT